MALKGDRIYTPMMELGAFMNETASRGGIVSYNSTASGVAMDQSVNLVTYVGSSLSGIKPMGILLQDMVNQDLTQTHPNWYKDTVQIGGKVAVLRVGQVTTNMVMPGHSPSAGAPAYICHSGYIGTSFTGSDSSDTTNRSKLVGRWDSAKDQDGYAKLTVNLP